MYGTELSDFLLDENGNLNVRTLDATGAASGIDTAPAEIIREYGNRVIGDDLRNACVTADRSARVRLRETLCVSGGKIEAIVAAAGISALEAIVVSVNFFGVTRYLEGAVPALAKSETPRVVVVSSMATLQSVPEGLVETLLADHEAKALEVGGALEEQGPRGSYLNQPSSNRALSRWVRRECITEAWSGAGNPLSVVAPGTVITNMAHEMLGAKDVRALVDAHVSMPLNYHSEAQVIAKLQLGLTSAGNTHIAAQRIYIAGGRRFLAREYQLGASLKVRMIKATV